LGLVLENKKLGRNIVLIFQHAEETGKGGKICCQALEKYRVSRIYAFHYIPGYDEGAILLRRGTFACASLGMTISFAGAPSHAAYPENGLNPGFAAARFISLLPNITNRSRLNGMNMCTLAGAEIGAKAFGSAAGSAEVWLTLRAWHEDELSMLISIIKETAGIEASKDGIEVSCSFSDIFPATVNDNATLEREEQICHKFGLDCIDISEPFRWSEDFGYYGSAAQAFMVGIGAGLDWPQLHTENYSFNDDILPAALRLFSALAELG
jgi:metal-dependent amidase/aminoacylase/carboxypeptidase family protein